MNGSFTLWKINDLLSLSYRVDSVSIIFLTVLMILWLASGIYSIYYMKKKENKGRYYFFYILVFFVLVLMSLSANFFTFYMNYELMTLTSAPLVMHEQTREARMAGIKYLLYSLLGAYCVLFGFYVLSRYAVSYDFVPGGNLDMSRVSGHEGYVLAAAFVMIVGFGVKAGTWPLHSWLTTAHPIAVSPASAVLSGAIVKSGVVGTIRVVFYLFGADFIRGTWVQTAWMIITLLTVFLGSTMAYFEPVLKKRLAYSTVSQVSYILFGLSVLEETAYNGAMLQFSAHAFSKCGLFLIAGLLIIVSGSVKVEDLRGVGKKYPVLLWAYTICALSMIGIPPTGGFLAKWYLIEGALKSGLGRFSWFGPLVLMISALLTAGYLLPLAMRGFMPGVDYEDDGKGKEKLPAVCMIPILALSVLCVFVGIIPSIFVGGGF